MFKLLQLIHVGSLLNVVYKRLKYFELFVIVLDGNQKNHKFHMKNKTKATSAICQKNKMSQEILRRKPGLTRNLEDWSDKHWQKTCGVLIRQGGDAETDKTSADSKLTTELHGALVQHGRWTDTMSTFLQNLTCRTIM